MKSSVFDFRSYKEFLSWYVDVASKSRGARTQLAAHAGCQSAYISQVLNGAAHLSLEQAEKISRGIGQTSEEGTYFLLLIQHDRAGTPSLKSHFSNQIQEILDKRSVLAERLQVKKTLSPHDQAMYYSSWHFAAVHVMLSIPRFQAPQEIADYLRIPRKRVSTILEFLCSIGLAVRAKGNYRIGTARIHLGTDSPMIAKHHANWRMKAITALDDERPQDLHYSSVVTLSRDDAAQIRGLLIDAIEELKGIIRHSPEEQVQCLAFDFFRL